MKNKSFWIIAVMVCSIGTVNATGNLNTGIFFDSDAEVNGAYLSGGSNISQLNNTMNFIISCSPMTRSPGTDNSCYIANGYLSYLINCTFDTHACGNNNMSGYFNPFWAYDPIYGFDEDNIMMNFIRRSNINPDIVSVYPSTLYHLQDVICTTSRDCIFTTTNWRLCVNESTYNNSKSPIEFEIAGLYGGGGGSYNTGTSSISGTGNNVFFRLGDNGGNSNPTGILNSTRERILDTDSLSLCSVTTTTTTSTTSTTISGGGFTPVLCNVEFKIIDGEGNILTDSFLDLISSGEDKQYYMSTGIKNITVTCGDNYNIQAHKLPEYPIFSINNYDLTNLCNTTLVIVLNKVKRYNYSVYFNKNGCSIDNGLTDVYLFSCDNENYYDSPQYSQLLSNCNNKIPNDVRLNSSGYYNYNNIVLDSSKNYLGLLRHSTIDNDFLYKLNIQPLVYNKYKIDFNVSKSCGSNFGNEVCFKAVDKVTHVTLPIEYWIGGTDTNLHSTSSGLACFNSTNLLIIYRIDMNSSNYDDLFTTYQFKSNDNFINPKIFYMNPKSNKITNISIYYYNLTGYILDSSGNKLRGINVFGGNMNYVTGITGQYWIYNLPLNEYNTIRTESFGSYDDVSKESYNDIEMNFTLNKNNNENTRTIDILVRNKENDNTYSPIEDAKVLFKTSGRNDISIYSGYDGHAILDYAFEDTSYTVIVSKLQYDSKTVSISNRENYKEITLIDSLIIECSLSGLVTLVNNSVNNKLENVLIELYMNGNKISDTKSNKLGYYEFSTECGKNYNIKSSYGGTSLSYNVRMLNAENPVIQNFEFSTLNSIREEKKESLVSFAWDYFVPIMFMVLTLLGALILTKLVDEFNR